MPKTHKNENVFSVPLGQQKKYTQSEVDEISKKEHDRTFRNENKLFGFRLEQLKKELHEDLFDVGFPDAMIHRDIHQSIDFVFAEFSRSSPDEILQGNHSCSSGILDKSGQDTITSKELFDMMAKKVKK